MTQREGAILTAYTGIMVCKTMDTYHKYVEELLRRPVLTHELPLLSAEIKEKARKDFIELMQAQK